MIPVMLLPSTDVGAVVVLPPNKDDDVVDDGVIELATDTDVGVVMSVPELVTGTRTVVVELVHTTWMLLVLEPVERDATRNRR